MGSDKYFQGVDITTLFSRYNLREGNFTYGFDPIDGTFVANGQEVSIKTLTSNGKIYTTVDEFRDKIQPYLVDMCMQ